MTTEIPDDSQDIPVPTSDVPLAEEYVIPSPEEQAALDAQVPEDVPDDAITPPAN